MKEPASKAPVARSGTESAVDAFLDKARDLPVPSLSSGRGRLVFALDATMSRQPTWDIAQSLQGRMFEAAEALGGLDVQLVYFRGFNECKASRFVAGGSGLSALMTKIGCRGGHTQIGKVLRHVLEEGDRTKLGAFVYVGDAMEENLDDLCHAAGVLGLRGTKGFLFHEGADARAAAAFREIARLTGGAYAAFDASAPERLGALLSAAAAYAAGGHAGLVALSRAHDPVARSLLSQLRS